MNIIILLLLHLLAFSHSASHPDLHVLLPPENGEGDYFLFDSFFKINLLLQRGKFEH